MRLLPVHVPALRPLHPSVVGVRRRQRLLRQQGRGGLSAGHVLCPATQMRQWETMRPRVVQVRRDPGLRRRIRRGGLPVARARPVQRGETVPLRPLRRLHPAHVVLRRNEGLRRRIGRAGHLRHGPLRQGLLPLQQLAMRHQHDGLQRAGRLRRQLGRRRAPRLRPAAVQVPRRPVAVSESDGSLHQHDSGFFYSFGL